MFLDGSSISFFCRKFINSVFFFIVVSNYISLKKSPKKESIEVSEKSESAQIHSYYKF